MRKKIRCKNIFSITAWALFLFRSLTLETDRLKRLEEDLRKREVTLSNMEVHVDQQVQMKLNK